MALLLMRSCSPAVTCLPLSLDSSRCHFSSAFDTILSNFLVFRNLRLVKDLVVVGLVVVADHHSLLLTYLLRYLGRYFSPQELGQIDALKRRALSFWTLESDPRIGTLK